MQLSLKMLVEVAKSSKVNMKNFIGVNKLINNFSNNVK